MPLKNPAYASKFTFAYPPRLQLSMMPSKQSKCTLMVEGIEELVEFQLQLPSLPGTCTYSILLIGVATQAIVTKLPDSKPK